MPLMTPYKCWRGRSDCVSLASVEGIPDDATDEQMETLDFEPVSFVCCGCVSLSERALPQDAYRLCFNNDVVDEMSDNDEQDLAHLSYVIAQTLAVIASRRVNSGEIVALDGDGLSPVETMQAPRA